MINEILLFKIILKKEFFKVVVQNLLTCGNLQWSNKSKLDLNSSKSIVPLQRT